MASPTLFVQKATTGMPPPALPRSPPTGTGAPNGFFCVNLAGTGNISSLPHFRLEPWKDHISCGAAAELASVALSRCCWSETLSSARLLLSAICEGGGDEREFREIVIHFQDQRFLQARAGAAAGHLDPFSPCAELPLSFADFRFGQVELEIRNLLVRDDDQLSGLRPWFIQGQ